MSRVSSTIVIAGGGTAGHVLPGIAIADSLVNLGVARDDLLWIGSQRGIECDIVPSENIELVVLSGRGIQRSFTRQNVGAAAGIAAALLRCIALFGRSRPSVVVTLGGYASLPAAVAAVLWRVPIVIAEQNAVPGAANALVGRFAKAAGVPVKDCLLPRARVTGNPVRSEIAAIDRTVDYEPARAARNVDPTRCLIAVFCGSLGSRRVNEAVAGLAVRWDDRTDVEIYHVCGSRDYNDYAQQPTSTNGIAYRVVEYEHDMDELLSAADIVVCRSGGTTVAELKTVGIPSILIPFPTAPGDHQRFNALPLVNAGAAELISDVDCTTDSLASALTPIVQDKQLRHEMGARAQSLAMPHAADDIAALVVKYRNN